MSQEFFEHLIDALSDRYLGIGPFQQSYRATLEGLRDAYAARPPYASLAELRAWVDGQMQRARMALAGVTGEPDPALAGRLQALRDLLILLA